MTSGDRDRASLLDMLAACREVRAYIGHGGVEEFMADGKTYRAIERCLEVIGGAARRISLPSQAAYPRIPWRKIVGLRNRISHEYGDVDYEEVFAIATVSVPELIEVLEPIFGQGANTPSASPPGRA
ncbi:MAG: HepT-like ribonuclease domain-containing protein [Arenimonas sp.]